jgi:hypothetical protein
MPGHMRTLRNGRRRKKARLLKEEPSGYVHRISHFRSSAVLLKGSSCSSLKGEDCEQMNLPSVFFNDFSQAEELRPNATKQRNQSNSDLTQL